MPSNILDAATEKRFIRWTGRKPHIAVMGEFSAGKSTLLNFILGANVLPTRVTATHVPAIWLKQGSSGASALALGQDGARRWVQSPKLDPDTLHDVAILRIQVNSPGLAQFDMIDTPGISDPNARFDTLARVAGYADFVLWCTHATQAWRQSEHAAWQALPERLRRNSILVVTRADKLVSPADKLRVRRRLIRETKGLFRTVVLLSTLQADAAHRQLDAPGMHQQWTNSGGAEFVAAMGRALLSNQQRRETLLMRKKALMQPATPPAGRARLFQRPAADAQRNTFGLREKFLAPASSPPPRRPNRILQLWEESIQSLPPNSRVGLRKYSLSEYLQITGRFLDRLAAESDDYASQLDVWQRIITLPLQENTPVDEALRQIRAKIVEV